MKIANKCGFTPKIAYEVNNFYTANDLVSNGYGATLILEPAADEYVKLKKAAYFKIKSPMLSKADTQQTVVMAYKKEKVFKDYELKFLELIRNV